MRRKKAARKFGASKPLSAHEAGKISPHAGKAPTAARKSVKYDDKESYRLPERLTVREEEVLSFLADGQTNAEISEREKITLKTVEKHIENIYPKLGVNSRADAAIWYWKRRYGQLEKRIPRE
jgi:DNA-binding NarL/FixJ family response regulator